MWSREGTRRGSLRWHQSSVVRNASARWATVPRTHGPAWSSRRPVRRRRPVGDRLVPRCAAGLGPAGVPGGRELGPLDLATGAIAQATPKVGVAGLARSSRSSSRVSACPRTLTPTSTGRARGAGLGRRAGVLRRALRHDRHGNRRRGDRERRHGPRALASRSRAHAFSAASRRSPAGCSQNRCGLETAPSTALAGKAWRQARPGHSARHCGRRP